MGLVWWAGGHGGWIGVDPNFRFADFSLELDAEASKKEMVKLTALAAHCVRHRGAEGASLSRPPPPHTDERGWRERCAQYLTKCLACLAPRAGARTLPRQPD
eukprot:gene978-41961_t